MNKALSTLLLFICIVTAIAISGCKKNSDSPDSYYITMSIDGNSFSFSDTLSALKNMQSNGLTINGYSKAEGSLQWSLSNDSIGTYIDTYDTSVKKLVYQFTVKPILYVSNNQPVYETLLLPDPASSNPITLAITNVTDVSVEGTFSGNLVNGIGGSSSITNGRFKVPFK